MDAKKIYLIASKVVGGTSAIKMINKNGDELDYDELLSEVKAWRVFDWNDETISVKETVDFLMGEWDDGYISDNVSQDAYDSAESIFEKYDLDKNGYPDEFDQLRIEIESKAVYNYDKILPDKVFFTDPNEIDFTGSVYSSSEDRAKELSDLKRIAKAHGFRDKDAEDVYNNATNGGVGGVGVIGSPSDALKNKIEGDAILYIRDSLNGSGSYKIRGRNKIIILKEKLAGLIDYGSRSLGDVYGTSDWQY